MFDTRHLNTLKVNPQRKPYNANYDATNHSYRSADPCFSVFICGSIQRFDAIIPMLSQSIQNSFA
jgi:hypothetical protein